MPDITLQMQFSELASLLELLAKKSKDITGVSEHFLLSQKVLGLTKTERKNLKDQVLSLSIPSTGGCFVLDPAIIISHSSASVLPTVKLPRIISATGMAETDNLNWLKDQKGPVVLREVKHRHLFNRDIHHGGLLTSSKHASVHLMEAWPLEMQSKAADVRPGIAKDDTLADCRLVCVKMAKDAEGKRRLQREGAALLALQDTGRVAVLWNPGAFAEYLDRGIVITLYQPVPPPQDSGHDVFLSLDELEDRIEELTRALAKLHKSGWIWLGLKPSHILYLHSKIDPRDHVPPLRIIGLENARCLAGSDSFEYDADSIWSAPELKTHQLKHRNNLKEMNQGSAAQSYIFGSGQTPAADMYSLGLLVSAYLARSPCPAKVSCQDLVRLFNAPVYNPAQEVGIEHWLIILTSELLLQDPLLRPTAEQVLQRISSGRRDRSALHNLEPCIYLVDAYVHPDTLQMVWPVVLKTTIIADQRQQSRLEDYVTVHAGIETPPGKVVADYRGRPVTKQYLQWLRHLKLHTHSLSDGDRGAYDGRRKCNGIFDMAFYSHLRQVRSILALFHKQEK